MFRYVTDLPPTAAPAPRTGPGRPAEGRVRLLAAAERLFATRGLEVPNREIVAAAGQHNQSAVTYHFGSRAGLLGAVREQHETLVEEHRMALVARLPGPGERTTRQLVEAHVRPLVTEMLRSSPSYWARLSELLADQPLFGPAASELPALMAAHLVHLPELEAAARVALTVRFLGSGLARWERDNEAAGEQGAAPLALFALVLTDLAVAMLDAPSSLAPPADGHPGGLPLAGHQA